VERRFSKEVNKFGVFHIAIDRPQKIHLPRRVSQLNQIDVGMFCLFHSFSKSMESRDPSRPKFHYRDNSSAVAHLAANSCHFASLTVATKTSKSINPQAIPKSTPEMPHLFSLRRSTRILWHTGLETILESSRNTLQVSHTSGTSGLPTLGLLAPVVLTDLGRRVAAA